MPRHLLASFMFVIVSWMIVIWLFWSTVLSMVTVWCVSDSFAHGFLILPISLYLIWARRRRIAPMIPKPNLLGLFLLFVSGFVWFIGNLIDTVVVQELALVAMLAGLVWTLVGSEITRVILFPLVFLLFAVPIGQCLDPLLQDFTALYTVASLKLSGVPIVWEGRNLYLPTGSWHVAKACSGLRYLITAVALGCLFAYISYLSWIRRISFIISSAIVAILCNCLRAYGIIMLAHMKIVYMKGSSHHIFGLLIFGVMMSLLCWFGLRWRESTGNSRQLESSNPRPSPVIGSTSPFTCSTKMVGLMAVSSIAILALAPLATRALSNRALTPVLINANVPKVFPPWKMLPEYIGNWAPNFPGANVEVMQSYTDGGKPVHLYIAYYASQSQGAELINPRNRIADKRKWVRLSKGQTRLIIVDKTFQAHEITMRSLQRTSLVWSWYWVTGQFTSNPYIVKLLQLKARLFGEPAEAAVIAISTDYDNQKTDANLHLQDFLQQTSLTEALNSFSTSNGKIGQKQTW